MLKSIDDKLKKAEKKLAKKQTVQELYHQQQREHGFDPFELDQEDYDIYRMSKLKDQKDMPKPMKEELHGKIYQKVEERNYKEEMKRNQEKEILEEFARAYGYDVRKHQPHYNNGEIDVEYLQAFVAECRAKQEKEEKERALAKQKEALKGKVKDVTKKTQPQKKLTVETESKPPEVVGGKSEKMMDAQQEEPVLASESPTDYFERDEPPLSTE